MRPYHLWPSELRITQLLQRVLVRHATFDVQAVVQGES